MIALWDTTVASRLQPGSDLLELALDRAAAGTPVRIAAPAVLEIAYGYERMADGDARYRALLAWFTRLLAGDAFAVVAFDGRAALIAGRLRGRLPHPPRGRDRRSKTMRQAAWLLDLQVAATAFAAGLDVVTENERDFGLIADALTVMFPDAPALEVAPADVRP